MFADVRKSSCDSLYEPLVLIPPAIHPARRLGALPVARAHFRAHAEAATYAGSFAAVRLTEKERGPKSFHSNDETNKGLFEERFQIGRENAIKIDQKSNPERSFDQKSKARVELNHKVIRG